MNPAGSASAPGKLFIAGEYAVVTPGRPAILVALTREIRAHVWLSEPENSHPDPMPRTSCTVRIDSSGFSAGSLTMTPHLSAPDAAEPAERAVQVLWEYANALGIEVPSCRIELTSTLVEEDGRKYGFGSSGAVIVAVISALSRAIGLSLRADDLFRLSALAAIAADTRASCADIATSVCRGWVYYCSFDRDRIHAIRTQKGILAAMAKPWEHLVLEPLETPRAVHLAIGWSGVPASTAALVSQLDAEIARRTLTLDEFLQANADGVGQLTQALESGDTKRALAAVSAVRTSLDDLDRSAGRDGRTLGIVTPALETMINLARECGAEAKTSGAGGGDCVVALAPDAVVASRVKQAWLSAGFACPEVGLARRQPLEKECA